MYLLLANPREISQVLRPSVEGGEVRRVNPKHPNRYYCSITHRLDDGKQSSANLDHAERVFLDELVAEGRADYLARRTRKTKEKPR